MKLALVFDDLVQFGGAENLLLALCEQFPNSPVFTSFASSQWRQLMLEKNIKLVESPLKRLPLVSKLYKIYGGCGVIQPSYETFNFDEFDIVFSISARYSHTILTKPGTVHIAYINSPGRMFWEPHDYFFGVSQNLIKPHMLSARIKDRCFAQRPDILIANSKTPQQRIKKYWGRESKIIYPFVEISEKNNGVIKNNADHKYFVVLSRLVKWKKADIVIDAFNKLSLPLKVVGDGPEKANLKGLSKKNIEFLGYVSDEKKVEVLANAKALIFPQLEDFGIVPLESMALGTPVIAYKKGGALETVINGETGLFFEEQTSDSLIKAIETFGLYDFSDHRCKSQAAKFSKKRFLTEINSLISSVY